MFRNSHAYIVAQSDMALFDGMVLASFVTQVRGMQKFNFVMPILLNDDI